MNAGPLNDSFRTPPVWQPGGEGGGGSVTVSENDPVALAPAASVTVTVNVEVPLTFGAPRRRPGGRSVNPAGTCPDHVYGGVPPLALKLVEKKLLTNTFWPAPMSQTPFAQVKKRESIASGAFVPVPVPVIGTVCGLPAALSVSVNVADCVPDAVGEKVIDTLQLVPAASVRPEQPSLTWVKSSGFAPPVAALLMNRPALPVFVIVIDCGALVVPIDLVGEGQGCRRERDHRRRSRRGWSPAASAASTTTVVADRGGGHCQDRQCREKEKRDPNTPDRYHLSPPQYASFGFTCP